MYVNLQCYCHASIYNQHLPPKLTIPLQVFDITARDVCPGHGGPYYAGGGSGAGGLTPAEVGLIFVFL